MREMCAVYINEKTGEVIKQDIGELNIANQFMYRVCSGEPYTGFHCEKGKEETMFNKLKIKEIKSRQEQIKKLQKEIKMFKNAQLK